mgnify:CR=1 FL=1
MLSKPKKRKMNPMLLNVLLISLLVHVAALVIFGSWTLVKYVIPDEADFEEPPAIEEVEPPKEVKIEIKPPQKEQQQPLKNLKMKQVGNIAIANVDVDLPNMEESFTVSGGLGSGGGSGLLGGTSGSLGIGMSDVSVFGLKTRAERILFVIDVNRQMLTDGKGGLNSFKIVKDEITDMVGNLSAGTLFNVMLMDRRKSMRFKDQLVPAGSDVHQELIKWLAPINRDANNVGIASGPKSQLRSLTNHPLHKDVTGPQFGTRGNETAFQTQLALENGVDAIFMVAGYHKGFERISRRLTEKEEADWAQNIARPAYVKQLAAHEAEKPEMEQRIRNTLSEINKQRAAKGQPPRVLDARHGVYSNVRELGLKWKTEHPGHKPVKWLDDREVEKYFKDLVEEIYTNKQAKEPSVNVVLLLAKDENFSKDDESRLKRYVRFFSGKSRIIRGLNEIKSASSSKVTTN